MGCASRRKKKYCKYCGGYHYLKRAFMKCKRKHKQEKWE